MVMLNVGLNRIRDLISTDIDKGQLGTGSTVASSTNTALVSAESTTLLALDGITTSDRAIKFDYVLPSTGGTSTTYREFELQSSATPYHYDRIVFTGISFTKDGTEDINITKVYFIDQK